MSTPPKKMHPDMPALTVQIRHFSEAVTDQNRIKFAEDILALYVQYNLDGIDMYGASQSDLLTSDETPTM